jgi:hypothetical protein
MIHVSLLADLMKQLKRLSPNLPEDPRAFAGGSNDPEDPDDPYSYVGARKKLRPPHLSASASAPLE